MSLVIDLIVHLAVVSRQNHVLRECRGCQQYLRGDLWPRLERSFSLLGGWWTLSLLARSCSITAVLNGDGDTFLPHGNVYETRDCPFEE